MCKIAQVTICVDAIICACNHYGWNYERLVFHHSIIINHHQSNLLFFFKFSFHIKQDANHMNYFDCHSGIKPTEGKNDKN